MYSTLKFRYLTSNKEEMSDNGQIIDTTEVANNDLNDENEVTYADQCDIFYAPESPSIEKVLQQQNQEQEQTLNTNEVIDEINEELNNELTLTDPEDDDNDEAKEDWRQKDKHIFILSDAGKPIYTL